MQRIRTLVSSRYLSARLLVLGTIVVAGFVIVSNWPKSDLDRLRATPAAALIFPGSTVISEKGIDSGTSFAYRQVATLNRILGSSASLETVLAFYRQEMQDAGWATGGGSTIIMSGDFELQACAWHTPGLVLRLGFSDPNLWAKSHPEGAYPTIYTIALYQESPKSNDVPCGRPTP